MKKLLVLALLSCAFCTACTQGQLAPRSIKNSCYAAKVTLDALASKLEKSEDPEVQEAAKDVKLASDAVQPLVDYFRGKKPEDK